MSKKALLFPLAVMAAEPVTVFGPISFTGNDAGWSGYTLRGVIANADLLSTANIVGNAVVTLQFAASTSGTLGGAYIGNWTGTDKNYDGSQVQLLFSGSGSSAISTSPLVSDPVAFNFNPGANGIAYAAYFSAGTCNAATTIGIYNAATKTAYMGGNHAGDTTFAGSANASSTIEVLAKVVMQ